MSKRYILGISVTNRVQNASDVQKVLSDCACYIKTRLGLHEVNENVCAPGGLIILEVYGGEPAVAELETKLKALEGLDVQKMIFDY